MSTIRQKTIAGLKQGDRFTVTRTFTQSDVERFADISLDYNPIHFEKRFTDVKNFKAPVCHGLLVGSLVTQIGGQIGWLASEMNFKFIKPVYVGDTITCHFIIRHIAPNLRALATISFTNQNQEIIAEASLKGIIPGHKEKEVMSAMIKEGDPTNKINKSNYKSHL